MNPERELMIIGCGPAAITAAIYAARKRIDVRVVSEDVGGQVATTFGIENYPGFQYITGPELVDKFREQMNQFDIDEDIGEKVTKLSRTEDGNFAAVTESGKELSARSVIIATGAHPRGLGVPGEEQYRGKGVSYCATCDAPLFADATVAVVGGGNSALSAAFELSRIASKVYLISRRQWRADEAPLIEGVRASRNIEKIIGYVVERIAGEEMVKGVTIKPREGNGRRSLTIDGIFIEIGLQPNTDFAKGLVATNKFGEIIVDCDTSTGVPGLFAAGDVTNVKDKQIVIAAGQGALAAMGVFEYLLKKR